jgi:hypothetical protein
MTPAAESKISPDNDGTNDGPSRRRPEKPKPENKETKSVHKPDPAQGPKLCYRQAETLGLALPGPRCEPPWTRRYGRAL